MAVTTFQNSEANYFEWLKGHSKGFVLNTRTAPSPDYMVLHRASCKLVREYLGLAQPGGFTERAYRKVCADSIPPIKLWASALSGTVSACSHCDPEEDELVAVHRDLLAQASESMQDTAAARQARLASAPKIPGTTSVTTTVFVRNPDVIAEVLLRANGKCERCGCKAPFFRKNGSPYLEVHHLVLLSKGGEDTVENAKAQCPNCHREVHFDPGGADG